MISKMAVKYAKWIFKKEPESLDNQNDYFMMKLINSAEYRCLTNVSFWLENDV